MKRNVLNKKVAAPLQNTPSARELAEQRRVILQRAVERLKQEGKPQVITPQQTWSMPKPPPGVIPAGARMAMDDAIDSYGAWAIQNSIFAEGQMFLGYPYLAELSQRPEYRVVAETWAQEMTRKWIRLVSTGDVALDAKSEKLQQIEAKMKALKVRESFRRCIEIDGFFGRSQIYMDFGVDSKDRDELKSPVGNGTQRLSRVKCRKGSLKHLRVIEPIWTYPNSYNANDPLQPDFFKPRTWFVMGQEIHSTRLLTFIGRPMPDLLKPMYSFGGLSLSQMSKPYIDNWLRTRQSVSDAISNYSIMVLLTDMAAMLDSNATTDLLTRAEFFNVTRDNRGLMIADKHTETLENVSMPLSGLDHLQAQAQEHQCAPTQIPLVKLTGISPSGLNATSEYEVEVFYNKVEAQQEAYLTENLSTLLNFIQLDLFGEIDPEIGFVYEKLQSEDSSEETTNFKTQVDSDVALITAGVISPQEARTRLADDEDSPYASLDTSPEALPEPPQQPGQETDEHGSIGNGEGGGESPDIADKPPQTANTVKQGNTAAEKSNKPIQSKPVAGAHDSNPNHDPDTGQFAGYQSSLHEEVHKHIHGRIENPRETLLTREQILQHFEKKGHKRESIEDVLFDLNDSGHIASGPASLRTPRNSANRKYVYESLHEPETKTAHDIALDFNEHHDADTGEFAKGTGEVSGRKNVSSKGLPVDSDGNVTLTHYSNREGITALNPHMYGSGLRGAESKRMQADPHNWVSRSYHGIGTYKKEAGLGNIKYTSKIPVDKLYDFYADPDHLRYKNVGEEDNEINVYEKAIKNAGYEGYYVNNPQFGGIVADTFNSLPVTQAHDAEFIESEHPRDEDGEFTVAGGGSKADATEQTVIKLSGKGDKEANAKKLKPFFADFLKAGFRNPLDDTEVIIGKAGVELHMTVEGNVHINFIRSLEQGGGHASKALDKVCEIADKHNVTLDLEAAPMPNYVKNQDTAMNKRQLFDWYARHGFVKQPKRGDHDYMVRVPQNAEQVARKVRQGSQQTTEKPVSVPIANLKLNPDGEATAQATWFWNPKYRHTNTAPIAISKKTGEVLDGYHRIEQAKRDGKTDIDAVYVDQKPAQDEWNEAEHPRGQPENAGEFAPALHTDNPGGEWLQKHRQYGKEHGTNQYGVPNHFGPVTASFSKKVMVPMEKLAKVPGQKGEQQNVRQDDLNRLKDYMGKTGHLPLMTHSQTEYAPFVQVDKDGKPWVNEGNHRIMAAQQLGWKHMPVEVRYFSGGEQQQGDWHPDTLLKDHTQLQGTPRTGVATKYQKRTVTAGVKQSKVLFEVAPNPKDIEASSHWNALDDVEKTAISTKVLQQILPEVLQKTGVKAKMHLQYGGYLEDTNPSVSLVLDRNTDEQHADALTRILGAALEQDSMMRVAKKPFSGSTEMGAVVVQVPKNISYNGVKNLYNTLRDSIPEINGHTTDAGRMVILVDKAQADTIGRKVSQVLGDDYDVGFDTLNVAWPEKGADNYGLQRQDQSGTGSTRSSIGDWLNTVHTKAIRLRQQQVQQYEAGLQQAA